MKKDRFERWLQNIYHTQDEEIPCYECFDLVSHYIDLELLGENPATKMPQLKQHLIRCVACQEEYEVLRDLARLAKEGQLPSLDDLQDLIPWLLIFVCACLRFQFLGLLLSSCSGTRPLRPTDINVPEGFQVEVAA